MKKNNLKKVLTIFTLLTGIFFIFTMTNVDMRSSSKQFDPNEVPYISTYYIKPIVSTKEDVIIDFYISDYNNNAYVSKDYSDTFTVTIKIDGKKDIIKKNLKAGDHSINIGKFKDIGEQNFSILCTDQYKRNSHELFNFFLVKDTSLVNEYTMTQEDLNTYNINNDNSKIDASSTREGIQNLLDDKKAQGYNKLKLLPGTYRIDHSSPIYIPTEFTLDLNQSTISLNGFTGDKALMIELNNTFDSHVINGTIQGDFYEHDYANSPNDSEWVNGVKIGGESKYSSFENLLVKDITGYGGTNGISNSLDGKLGYTYLEPTAIGDTFVLGDIDRDTGNSIESKNRTTSDFVNIKDYANIGYLSISRYLGYQGNSSSSWNLIVHFYNKDKEFIQSTDAYEYRRIGVPSDSVYMKVTLLNESYPTDLSVQLFRVPTHCAFKNITFENCRAVGLAQEAMNNMLVENCTFTNSGQTLAKCAYDAEDGWDLMQDVTFRGLNFYDNPHNEFLTAAGHNFIIEDSNMSIYIWGRTRNIVIRDSSIDVARIHNDGLVKTGVPRFINNKVKSSLTFANTEEADYFSVVRDSSFNGPILNGIANNCTFNLPNGYLENVIINNSTINNFGAYLHNNVSFNNCNFTSSNILSLKFNQIDSQRIFNKCTFDGKTELLGNYFNSAIFNDCTFDDVNISVNSPNKLGALQFNNCDMSYSTGNFLDISSDTSVVFNNCTINNSVISNKDSSLIYLSREPTSGSTIFKNCKIEKSSGYVLDGYYPVGHTIKNPKYTVELNKSDIDIQLLSEKYQCNNYTVDIK